MTGNLSPSHIILLQEHRAIAVQQLHDITSTINGLDALLSGEPLTNSTDYTVNDKVISLSAPNKDRIGLVTKVTPNYIHVTPINTRFTSFKKITENLAHFPLRGDQTSLEDYILRANISPESPSPSTAPYNTILPQPSPPSSPASDAHRTPSHPPSSPDTSTTTISLPPTPSTPRRTSSRRFTPPPPSSLSPETRSRYRYRSISKPTRSTSLARSARCARSDTRPTPRKRTKR